MNSNHFIQEPILPYHADGEDAAIQKRREAYLKRLAAYLKDPEFRSIEGFPHGTDEAILALSDPPYYTACPNPFLEEVLEEWHEERKLMRAELNLPDEKTKPYSREPFASDVSEGKHDPIYLAHSYHTKVPHKAIMRYILHYTEPGDIVFDGFCGTGMTGIAAQFCGDKKEVEKLGYLVDKDGVIYDGDEYVSILGARKAVLNDLSPIATYISYNYSNPVNIKTFKKEAENILQEVKNECGWMYKTWHPHCDNPNRVKGKINYTVWSDVFRCPQCGEEMIYWKATVDLKNRKSLKNWNCPRCNSLLSKNPRKNSAALRVEQIMETFFDPILGYTIQQKKQEPVMINYSVGKSRYEKQPDKFDLELISKIQDEKIPYTIPKDRMPEGDESRRNDDIGLTHVHHFYTKRNVWILSSIKARIDKFPQERMRNFLRIWFTASQTRLYKLNRYIPKHKRHVGPLSGTLYVSSNIVEISPFYFLDYKANHFAKLNITSNKSLISTFSSTHSNISESTYDYIFIDPPFGSNLTYSDLNFIWESWIGVKTSNNKEVIVSKAQRKKLKDYENLMEKCFEKFYKTLKPRRWITVEFHNSHNSVWNAIQESLLQTKFVVADVRTLDKQKGTTKQLTYKNATKQDLIISAYKPSMEFENKFQLFGGTIQGAWDFISQHLEQLPMPEKVGGQIEIQAERTPYLLYDRMLAFHLVRGLTIPLSASEFYQGLSKGSFLMREGMVFTIPQAHQYDQLRLSAEGVQQLSLFVTDEASAVQWLRGQLDKETGEGPQTYAEIQPKFLKQLHTERYEELPELQTILKQNFLQDEEERWYVPDPSRQADLDAIKERALMHEYNEIARGKGKIKVFRSEAITTGFSKAWAEHNYDQIVAVAKRLPEQALQEDPKLKLYVDNARIRASKQPKQEKLL